MHWRGTDAVGRDVLARIIWGARASLSAGLVSLGIAGAIIAEAPWRAFWPGFVIFFAALSFNLLDDGLRDPLAPRHSSAARDVSSAATCPRA